MFDWRMITKLVMKFFNSLLTKSPITLQLIWKICSVFLVWKDVYMKCFQLIDYLIHYYSFTEMIESKNHDLFIVHVYRMSLIVMILFIKNIIFYLIKILYYYLLSMLIYFFSCHYSISVIIRHCSTTLLLICFLLVSPLAHHMSDSFWAWSPSPSNFVSLASTLSRKRT